MNLLSIICQTLNEVQTEKMCLTKESEMKVSGERKADYWKGKRGVTMGFIKITLHWSNAGQKQYGYSLSTDNFLIIPKLFALW